MVDGYGQTFLKSMFNLHQTRSFLKKGIKGYEMPVKGRKAEKKGRRRKRNQEQEETLKQCELQEEIQGVVI